MLTGKCKKDFEKWLWAEQGNVTIQCYSGEYCDSVTVVGQFEELPLSMQYGVYVDFFDSVGIECFLIYSRWGNCDLFEYTICINDVIESQVGEIPTRNEARTKAMEKACEIYNNSVS